jgi:uncharacterized repeat protein (TIGR03803 family)
LATSGRGVSATNTLIQVELATAKTPRLVIGIILLVLAGRAFNANAQTETNLYSFGSSPNNGPEGEFPLAGLVQGTDGNFYGTTASGGTNLYFGTVFRISPSGNETDLYSFGSSPTDGNQPAAGLVQGSDGNFYGTTEGGGTPTSYNNVCQCAGYGTVFRISPSGSETNLHLFNGPDGANPAAGLVQGSDGNFYGTTYQGGTYNSGTVFRITASGSETNLHSFGSTPNDGSYPQAGLVQGGDGNFYGTTYSGGTIGLGTVFRISPSGNETNLHSFVSSPDGANPLAGLVQGSDGDFYGTTRLGGTNGVGAVFRISPSGNETVLYSFGGYPNDGLYPYAGLVQGSDGNFYGTAWDGGLVNFGTVFRISPSGSYRNLYSFRGFNVDGAFPVAGLVQGNDGNFYGTAELDGSNGEGTVFELTVPLNPPPYPINQISAIQFFNILDSTIVALPIASVAGETYQLQYSDSLSPLYWLNTGGTITSIGGPLILIDIAEPLPPQRFYRAAITP